MYDQRFRSALHSSAYFFVLLHAIYQFSFGWCTLLMAAYLQLPLASFTTCKTSDQYRYRLSRPRVGPQRGQGVSSD